MGRSIITMAVRRILFAALFVSALFAFTLADDAATPTDVDAPSEEDEFDPVKDGTKEMEEMDADKDGKATLEEVKKFMKEVLASDLGRQAQYNVRLAAVLLEGGGPKRSRERRWQACYTRRHCEDDRA